MLQFQDRLEESAEEDDRRERRNGDNKKHDNDSLSLAQQYGD